MTGTALAVLAAVVAVILPLLGTARGIKLLKKATSGLSEDAHLTLDKVQLLQILPGTQVIYGFLAVFVLLDKTGLLSGSAGLSSKSGAAYLAASLPVAVVGYFSAAAQGKAAAEKAGSMTCDSTEIGKLVTAAAKTETLALLALLITLLAVFNIPKLGL